MPERPLGPITPVATSATLGDKGDPGAMVEFAETVFGEPFDADAVVTESRLDLDRVGRRRADVVRASPARRRADLGPADVDREPSTAARPTTRRRRLAGAVVTPPVRSATDCLPHDVTCRHHLARTPTTRRCCDAGASIAASGSPSWRAGTAVFAGAAAAQRRAAAASAAFARHLVGAAQPRPRSARARAVASTAPVGARADPLDRPGPPRRRVPLDRRRRAPSPTTTTTRRSGSADLPRRVLPALRPLRLGRRLSPAGGQRPRRRRRRHPPQPRDPRGPVPGAAVRPARGRPGAETSADVEGLRWFHVDAARDPRLAARDDDPDFRDGWVLPVLTLVGAGRRRAVPRRHLPVVPAGRRDPVPRQRDRDPAVGDAVDAVRRHRTWTRRRRRRSSSPTRAGRRAPGRVRAEPLAHPHPAVGAARRRRQRRRSRSTSSSTRRSARPGTTSFRRYRLVPPDLADRTEFGRSGRRDAAVGAARRPQAGQGRGCCSTRCWSSACSPGSAARWRRPAASSPRSAPPPRLAAARPGGAREHAAGHRSTGSPRRRRRPRSRAWVRGVLERMRERGAIEHPWFGTLHQGGRRPVPDLGRPAQGPGHARVPERPRPRRRSRGSARRCRTDPLLDPVTSAQSWYARWTARALHVERAARCPAGEGAARAARRATASCRRSRPPARRPSTPSRTARSSSRRPSLDATSPAGECLLVCDVCRNRYPAPPTVVDQLDGAPCLLVRCPGTCKRTRRTPDNYYRRLYASGDPRRVVAREHTSLLDDATRSSYETGFKSSENDPTRRTCSSRRRPWRWASTSVTCPPSCSPRCRGPSPPTCSGSAGPAGSPATRSNLAFVTGRGEHLPRLGDPLSVINGAGPAAGDVPRRRGDPAAPVHRLTWSTAWPATADGTPRAGRRGASAATEPARSCARLVALAEEDAGRAPRPVPRRLRRTHRRTVEALREWATPIGRAGRRAGSPSARSMAAASGGRHEVESSSTAVRRSRQALPGAARRSPSCPRRRTTSTPPRSAEAALAADPRAARRAAGTSSGSACSRSTGVLPNYTLLDDAVTLDVALTWIDPDTQEYVTDQVVLPARLGERAARVRARRGVLRPGPARSRSTRSTSATRAAPSGRGRSARTADTPSTARPAPRSPPPSCPRCGEQGDRRRQAAPGRRRADPGLRRDAPRRGRDHRPARRPPPGAVLDVRRRRRRPGARHRPVVRRGLRLRAEVPAAHGHPLAQRRPGRRLRGLDVDRRRASGRANLFRVCAGCGKLDRATGRNRPDEHRAWCRYRNALRRGHPPLALMRTLRTQGVLLRLPPMVDDRRRLRGPEPVAAALLLGLREQLGGAPDHLAVVQVADPTTRRAGPRPRRRCSCTTSCPAAPATSPSSPTRRGCGTCCTAPTYVVRDCPCADEPRLACHRCLLPFAGRAGPVTSPGPRRNGPARDPAAGSAAGGDPPRTGRVGPRAVRSSAFDPESKMEQQFRAVLRDRLSALGATVKEHPGQQRGSARHHARRSAGLDAGPAGQPVGELEARLRAALRGPERAQTWRSSATAGAITPAPCTTGSPTTLPSVARCATKACGARPVVA